MAGIEVATGKLMEGHETPKEKPSSAVTCSTPTRQYIYQNIYDHGGSRIWREHPDGRELLADTYGNADMAVSIKKCIEDFLA